MSELFFTRKSEEAGIHLNDIQRRAVLDTEGPLLLLASPGSGKTTTLIMRIGYLIAEKGVAPSRIKAVTFSRAAARDMKARFSRLFPELPAVEFSTIHSFAFEVVRENLRRSGTAYRLIEGSAGEANGRNGGTDGGANDRTSDKKRILRGLYKTFAGETITKDQMEALTAYISYVKNKLIAPADRAAVRCEVKQAGRLYEEYETFKRSGTERLLIDYDDMLTMANELLEADGPLLDRYRQRYDYVLTDESQDTSAVQHAIVGKLAGGHGNLCVVADDDQSIYGWRGAEPSYLLNFREMYPDAEILFMEQNYRSSGEIVQAANRFIKRNKNRYDKNMFTHNEGGRPIVIRRFTDYGEQARHVAKELRELDRPGEAAALYRNNSSAVMLMNELDGAGIPFTIRDSDNRFFSHWIVRDMLNVMRMTFNDRRTDLLEAVYTKLNGYITRHQMEVLKQIGNTEPVFDNLLNIVGLQDYQRKPIEECRDTLLQMRGMPPLEAIRVIRTRLGYDKALDKMVERFGFGKEAMSGVLSTLEEIARGRDSMESLAKRLKELELLMRSSGSGKPGHAVTLSTFHSSKGLEFQRVYMVDLVQGVIPSSDDEEQQREGNPEPMEEAARLFYVGMTRAKEHLELLSYKYRDGEQTAESSFVAEMRKQATESAAKPAAGSAAASVSRSAAPGDMREIRDAIPYNPNAFTDRSQLAVGARVKHRVFGRGEIRGLAEGTVSILFSTGMKALSLSAILAIGILEPDGGDSAERDEPG